MKVRNSPDNAVTRMANPKKTDIHLCVKRENFANLAADSEWGLRVDWAAVGKEGFEKIARELTPRSGAAKQERADYARIRQNLRAVLTDDEIARIGWPKYAKRQP